MKKNCSFSNISNLQVISFRTDFPKSGPPYRVFHCARLVKTRIAQKGSMRNGKSNHLLFCCQELEPNIKIPNGTSGDGTECTGVTVLDSHYDRSTHLATPELQTCESQLQGYRVSMDGAIYPGWPVFTLA